MPSDTSDQKVHGPQGRRVRLWAALRARPRLLGCIVLGVSVYVLGSLFFGLQGATMALLAWNAACVVYLLLCWRTTQSVPVDVIRSRAVIEDEGRMTILLLVVIGAAAVLLAVGSQLGHAKALHGPARGAHLSLALVTIVTSWLFTQVLFALHYAHDFYINRHREQPEPLQFPGTQDPDYGDFFYFSCIIGTAAQTADVAITGSALRRVVTLHCVLSFFFNATLLALTINVAAGLLQ